MMIDLGLMLDTETVSMEDNAALCQIAAVFYNTKTFEVVDTFCENVDYKELVKLGFHKEQSVMDWWRKQDKDVIKSVFENPKDPTEVANQFIKWVDNVTEGCKFDLKSNHIMFDLNKMDYFLNTLIGVKLTKKTNYRKIEDFATIRNLAKMLDADLLEEMEDEYENQFLHNALDDCLWQLNSLQASMEIIAGSSNTHKPMYTRCQTGWQRVYRH